VRGSRAEIRRAHRDVGDLGELVLRSFEPRDLAAIASLWPRSRMRSPMQIATSLGSSAPLTGNSQLPRSSFLPMQIG